MARIEATLTTCMIASDYDPAHHNWTEKELAALGNCKATAEVIKARLENNGTKVKEMYVIEHKGEKKSDSKSKEHHKGIDETELHYQLLIKFEPSHGATLKDIARFIGVPPEVIEKPHSGRFSYDNMLSYLTHIKYADKIQYAPEDVVTLAGTDYMDYFNANKERWKRARDIVTKKGGKTFERLFREAMSKLEAGELSCEELAGMAKYRKLFLHPKYQPKLEKAQNRVKKLALIDYRRLETERNNGKISLEEAAAREEYKLAFKYCTII